MLLQQQKIQFSEFSRLYDVIVTKENLLRKINELIDFGFIYNELLDKYCQDNGRAAESPVRMFKYLLLKTIFTVSEVSIKSGLHKEQMIFQETEYYRDKARHRYKIEAKNSELKNVHGYGRGIDGMEMQGALAIFTVNLKGIIKLAI